jgi:hypothetical protein
MPTRAVPNLLPLLIASLALPLSLLADEPKLHVLWDTVSPDGRYALAWTTTEPEDHLYPDQDPTYDSIPVTTWLIEIPTSKTLAQLPNLHFWDLKSKHPDHYWLDTTWSEDSRYVLVLVQQHFSRHNTTVTVLLGDTFAHTALDLTEHISDAIKEKVTKTYDGSYFLNPWFVGTDRFLLSGDAGKHDYDFYFQFDKSGKSLALEKTLPPKSTGENPDRQLNRAYRKLHGLLSADDQKTLVEDQRAWLTKRDAIKSAAKKDEFVNARSTELENRATQIIAQKSD